MSKTLLQTRRRKKCDGLFNMIDYFSISHFISNLLPVLQKILNILIYNKIFYMNFLDMNFNMNFIICCILKRSDQIFLYCLFFILLKLGCRRVEFMFLFLWISFDYNKPFIDMEHEIYCSIRQSYLYFISNFVYPMQTIHKNKKTN